LPAARAEDIGGLLTVDAYPGAVIAVERRGRLGNQMFQYAFGVAASARLGTDFTMATDELEPLFVLSGRGGLARVRRSLEFRLRRSSYPVIGVESDTEPEAAIAGLVDRATYTGFFQSERYFADARGEVEAAFAIRARHVEAFESRYGDLLGAPYVCCHVRRTDYHVYDGGVVLPPSYYDVALAAARTQVSGPVVVVADDLDEVRELFPAGTRFEHNEPIVDLQLMIHAAAFVSSNSSLSWWGGWLGERAGRLVVAPRLWLGFRRGYETPRGVVPERWLGLAV
jgi:hypothetical protein